MPINSRYRFDIPPLTRVTIEEADKGYRFMGVVMENPIDTKTPDTVVLHKCTGGDYQDRNGPRITAETRSFNIDVIKKISLGELVADLNAEEDRPERLMATHRVTSMSGFLSILDNIEKLQLKSVVVSGLGGNLGRLGDLGWLCLVVQGLLVCIDVMELSKQDGFWRTLEKRLLKNNEITKIFHNARPLIDYLFHKHCITILNIFDTQVAELYIRCHQNRDNMPRPEKMHLIDKKNPCNWEYVSVSQCYKLFVPHLVVSEELQLLEKHEGKYFNSLDSPYTKRPIPSDTDEQPYFKLAALKVKYLQYVYEAQIKTLMSHVTLCMREEVKVLTRGNNAQALDKAYIPSNVMEMMMNGSPFLNSDRKLDYLY